MAPALRQARRTLFPARVSELFCDASF
jgi:hypothetical protein